MHIVKIVQQKTDKRNDRVIVSSTCKESKNDEQFCLSIDLRWEIMLYDFPARNNFFGSTRDVDE